MRKWLGPSDVGSPVTRVDPALGHRLFQRPLLDLIQCAIKPLHTSAVTAIGKPHLRSRVEWRDEDDPACPGGCDDWIDAHVMAVLKEHWWAWDAPLVTAYVGGGVLLAAAAAYALRWRRALADDRA